jgi:ACS family tartrate transporter-like MFS transporter
MKDATGSYSGGLYGLALLTLISSLVCAFFLHIPDIVTPAQHRPALAPAR